jgi:hypothetical protein
MLVIRLPRMDISTTIPTKIATPNSMPTSSKGPTLKPIIDLRRSSKPSTGGNHLRRCELAAIVKIPVFAKSTPGVDFPDPFLFGCEQPADLFVQILPGKIAF